MKNLQGKVAFVTGGSSGIGQGIVEVLAEEGMKVAFSYRRQEHLDQTMAYFRSRPQLAVHPIKVDVTDRKGLSAAKREIEGVYGKVQLLINNAGIGIHGPMELATFSDWDWIMSVNNSLEIRAPYTMSLSRRKSDRQCFRPVTDGRHPRLGLPSRFEALNVIRHRAQKRIGLQPGENPAHTGVHTITPAEMAAIVTTHVELVRPFPLTRIAVCRRDWLPYTE